MLNSNNVFRIVLELQVLLVQYISTTSRKICGKVPVPTAKQLESPCGALTAHCHDYKPKLYLTELRCRPLLATVTFYEFCLFYGFFMTLAHLIEKYIPIKIVR